MQVFVTIKVGNGRYNVAFRTLTDSGQDMVKGFDVDNLADLMVEIQKRLEKL